MVEANKDETKGGIKVSTFSQFIKYVNIYILCNKSKA